MRLVVVPDPSAIEDNKMRVLLSNLFPQAGGV